MNRLIKGHSELARMMRAGVPKNGDDWDKFIAVLLKPGEKIKSHKHVYHTVLYYPESCEPIVITPTDGAILYMPPGTEHEVPVVKDARMSVAMLVKDDAERQNT